MSTTIPIENGQQISILITSGISIALVAITVGLRLVAKRISVGFDYSDYFAVGALVGAPEYCAMLSVNTNTKNSWLTLDFTHAYCYLSPVEALASTLRRFTYASALIPPLSFSR